MLVTPEEILAGKDQTFEVEIPGDILHPSLGDDPEVSPEPKTIKLRPLTVEDVQLIAKAAKDDEVLTSVLMIQRSVVAPPLKHPEIARMPSGLARFLVDCINRISGLSTSKDEIQEIINAPLVRAFFILAKEFNWTPQQVERPDRGPDSGVPGVAKPNQENGESMSTAFSQKSLRTGPNAGGRIYVTKPGRCMGSPPC